MHMKLYIYIDQTFENLFSTLQLYTFCVILS